MSPRCSLVVNGKPVRVATGDTPLDAALPRTVVAVAGFECTVRDDRARAELGYEPVIDLDRGMEELAARRKRAPSG